MRIILVDDKQDSSYILKQMLNTSGHQVVWVRNGADALAYLQEHSCDLIISDILMPTMDGYQFCKKVKADSRLMTIPFFFFTATYTDQKDEDFALLLGADRFIRKPIEPEDFLEMVNEVMNHKPTAVHLPPGAHVETIEDTEVLKLYNERLVNKLEKKVLDLEREVTERKQTEETKADLTKILEISLNELYVFDAKTLRFLKVNRGARQNLQYSIDELRQLTPLDLMTNLDGHSFGRLLNCLKSGEQHIEFHAIHRRKDGSIYPMEVHLESGSYGGVSVYVAIVLDISERVKGQEALRQSEKQVYQLQKMEALGRMSAGIAHDFNNILGAILGCTELAIKKLPPEAEPQQFLNQILKASLRAKELVKQILTFCCQVEHKPQPIELHVVVGEALKLLRATLPSTIEIRECLATEETTILADSTQIHQVILNLCANAEYAMREEGGVLEVLFGTSGYH